MTRAHLFDKFFGEDEAKKAEKDRMMAEQKAILDMRKNKSSRAAYFERVEAGRKKKQEEVDMWKFQKDTSKDPLGRWKELRKEGMIGNLKREETEGGIPIPMPSFGVREYDEGARFDLRLPYVDQGYVDEDADVMGKIGKLFGGGGGKSEPKTDAEAKPLKEEKVDKKFGWW